MTRQPDPATALDLDAIADRVAWVVSTGFAAGDNARRLVAEDVPALVALARRLLAERDRLTLDRVRTAARLRRERGLRRAAVDLLVEQCDARDAARAVLRPLVENPYSRTCLFCGHEGEGWHLDGCPVLDRARLLGDAAGTG